MTVLVTGGAGYIGSHMAHTLVEKGEHVVVVDDLSRGDRSLVPLGAEFVPGCVGDPRVLERIFRSYPIDAVIHFAGYLIVSESMQDPMLYYERNTTISRTLIEACVAHDVDKIIFSSTASVYGAPTMTPTAETAPIRPISPYGRSKLMTEMMLEDACAAHGLRSVFLRYFNVAGADPRGRTGQISRTPTHLIKIASQVALGLRSRLSVYGTDYPTADGTCVRDYIHVSDLVAAHDLALEYLRAGEPSTVFNCGYGQGYSVLDVINAFERVMGSPLPTQVAPRRAGDPPALVADASLLSRTLGWRPLYDDLEYIIETALAWERATTDPVKAPRRYHHAVVA